MDEALRLESGAVDDARSHFLRYVARLVPSVLEPLWEDVLPIYRQTAGLSARMTSGEIVTGPELETALNEWSKSYYLDAEWVKETVRETLCRWVRDGSNSAAEKPEFALHEASASAHERFDLVVRMNDVNGSDEDKILALLRREILVDHTPKVRKISMALLAYYQIFPQLSLTQISRNLGISRQALSSRIKRAADFIGIELRASKTGGRPRSLMKRVTRKRRRNAG